MSSTFLPFCVDMDPCKTNPCGENESCSVERPNTGKRNCTCFDNFVRKNRICVPTMGKFAYFLIELPKITTSTKKSIQCNSKIVFA